MAHDKGLLQFEESFKASLAKACPFNWYCTEKSESVRYLSDDFFKATSIPGQNLREHRQGTVFWEHVQKYCQKTSFFSVSGIRSTHAH